MDMGKIMAALKQKTVENGSTPAEAEAAIIRLKALEEKHGKIISDGRPAKRTEEQEEAKRFQRYVAGLHKEANNGLVKSYLMSLGEDRLMAMWRESMARPQGGEERSVPRAKDGAYWKAKKQGPPGKRKPIWDRSEAPTTSVGDCAEWWIMNSTGPYDDIAEEVRTAMRSATTAKSVAWYASALRKQGYDVPKRRR